jgi:hypothetical protein
VRFFCRSGDIYVAAIKVAAPCDVSILRALLSIRLSNVDVNKPIRDRWAENEPHLYKYPRINDCNLYEFVTGLDRNAINRINFPFFLLGCVSPIEKCPRSGDKSREINRSQMRLAACRDAVGAYLSLGRDGFMEESWGKTGGRCGSLGHAAPPIFVAATFAIR